MPRPLSNPGETGLHASARGVVGACSELEVDELCAPKRTQEDDGVHAREIERPAHGPHAPQLRDSSRPELKRAIDRVFNTGEPGSFEAPVRLPDGSAVWYRAAVGAIRDKCGDVCNATLSLTDTTEHKLQGLQLAGILRIVHWLIFVS